MKQKIQLASVASNLILGFFLVLDKWIFHGITFDYGSLHLEWLDAYWSHGGVGLILIAVGVICLVNWVKTKGLTGEPEDLKR